MIDWQGIVEAAPVIPMQGLAWRVVESQEQIATTFIVETLSEQAQLEEMLETSKPGLVPGTERLDYLLATPFRYPPLRHGSRYGTRQTKSLLYASFEYETALAEAAHYRFYFYDGMDVPPPEKIITHHTVFSFEYAFSKGLSLHKSPFDEFRDQLVDKFDYQHTQALGRVMRDFAIEGFEFESARTENFTVNLGIYSPLGIKSSKPLEKISWMCETTGKSVSFRSRHPDIKGICMFKR